MKFNLIGYSKTYKLVTVDGKTHVVTLNPRVHHEWDLENFPQVINPGKWEISNRNWITSSNGLKINTKNVVSYHEVGKSRVLYEVTLTKKGGWFNFPVYDVSRIEEEQ